MRVTVCELNCKSPTLARDWERLISHVQTQQSELVLLPEMPFYTWFAGSQDFNAHVWQEAVSAHDAWQSRLCELAPVMVLSSRPVNRNRLRLNEGFCWSEETGYRAAHHKYYLPDEEGYWEASWYDRGDGSFMPVRCGAALIGFEICTELWAMDHARLYSKEGVHIIATPRATPKASLERWLVGGRATAIVSGAFSLSSNHASAEPDAIQMGGQGWVIAPDGEVLGLTSQERPFVTVEIDLDEAEQAKHTYPRYAL
jgi:N-carbamoylputrescine amidase